MEESTEVHGDPTPVLWHAAKSASRLRDCPSCAGVVDETAVRVWSAPTCHPGLSELTTAAGTDAYMFMPFGLCDQTARGR